MKTYFQIAITSETEGCVGIYKEVENFSPYAGMEIEDSAFADARKALSVRINTDVVEAGEVAEIQQFVVIDSYALGTDGGVADMEKMFRAHGWRKAEEVFDPDGE